jgi:hypothetical protein
MTIAPKHFRQALQRTPYSLPDLEIQVTDRPPASSINDNSVPGYDESFLQQRSPREASASVRIHYMERPVSLASSDNGEPLRSISIRTIRSGVVKCLAFSVRH